MILCSLPESQDSLAMAVSNFISGANTLVFDDVVSVILSKKIQRKTIGETSSSALSIENRGRQRERGKNQGNQSKSKANLECWLCGKKGH